MVCQCVPVCPSVPPSSLANVHAVSHWSGPFTASGFCGAIAGSSLGLFLIFLLLVCHADPAALDQQSEPFCPAHPFADRRHRALDLGLGGPEVVSMLALLYLHHQDELFSTALARPPNAAVGRMEGQLCSHAHQAGSSAPRPPEAALMHCPVKSRGPVAHVPQPARGWPTPPFSHPQAGSPPCLCQQGSFTVLPR